MPSKSKFSSNFVYILHIFVPFFFYRFADLKCFLRFKYTAWKQQISLMISSLKRYIKTLLKAQFGLVNIQKKRKKKGEWRKRERLRDCSPRYLCIRWYIKVIFYSCHICMSLIYLEIHEFFNACFNVHFQICNGYVLLLRRIFYFLFL